MKNELKVFENSNIRSVYDEEKETYYFSVVDIVAILIEKDYQSARKYWNKLAQRLRDEGSEQTVTNCHQLNFMFQLSKDEWQSLRSQFVTLRSDIRKYSPYVFTEQGVAMLSGILKSRKAIETNIQIMRTFVKMRKWAIENKEIAQRLADLEHYFIEHCKENHADMRKIYEAINLLMDRTKPNKIGFEVE